MPIRPRTPRCAVAVALAATTCRPPCPDVPASPAPVARPEPAPAPAPLYGPPPTACTLSPTDVRARSVAYLAALAGTSELPPGLETVDECTSHCMESRGRRDTAERCDSWECPFRYGHARPWLGDAGRFSVHVIGCGERVFAELDLAACFAKPHRCAFAVDREQAEALAARDLDFEAVRLDWTADAEFRWRVLTGDVELASISVHVPGDIQPGPGAPSVPLRPKQPERPPKPRR